jgi:hypothetical protein
MNLTRLYGDWDPSNGLTDDSDYIGINISDCFDSPSAGAATFVKGTDEGDRGDCTITLSKHHGLISRDSA